MQIQQFIHQIVLAISAITIGKVVYVFLHPNLAMQIYMLIVAIGIAEMIVLSILQKRNFYTAAWVVAVLVLLVVAPLFVFAAFFRIVELLTPRVASLTKR